jgi:hypothetical protein
MAGLDELSEHLVRKEKEGLIRSSGQIERSGAIRAFFVASIWPKSLVFFSQRHAHAIQIIAERDLARETRFSAAMA